ncbi:MAG: hypothetical protein M1838_006083 [Thelocarpon superellum]|nr:MAG: hypothetical protein M1838_006083 [Thelocarpon superellum]
MSTTMSGAPPVPSTVPLPTNGQASDANPITLSRSTSLSSRNPYNIARSDDDPFQSTPTAANAPPHRFSQFDPQLFDLASASSPSQMRQVLEAHLAETERRIQDASKLGTTLVQQRRDLSRRLKDVEAQQKSGEIGPELKQKLLDIEKEYHEVGRESARAMLGPKSTLAAGEGAAASPFPVDGRGRPASPNKYSSDAPDSPSKMSVPSRRGRNQAANGVQDSEFYAEISTSLLAQVRNLQAVIAEREESLKAVTLEKSRLEVEAEGFSQRLRGLDESEQRYKDENWTLETQMHELIAKLKHAAEREQKLTHQLTLAGSEKSTTEKDLDDLRQAHGKLSEDHAAVLKHHDLELSSLRRDLTAGESEKLVLQRKLEELNSQNNELAQAVAGRLRHEDAAPVGDLSEDNMDVMAEFTTPENSPPPSPSKGTPRHSMLESETLKSSLHHAHRMIQNLKGNITREKTEKIELKRMLQEARDEIEMRRNESNGAPNSGSKRRKPGSEKELFKKPVKPTLLGAGRASTNEVLLDEAGWEDHMGENGVGRDPNAALAAKRTTFGGGVAEPPTESSDAFETANERETDNDAFQTGAESLGGDSSDELTETEAGVARGGTLRGTRAPKATLAMPGNRNSFASTASTSADDDVETDLRTPTLPQQQRYRLKMGRGGPARRSRASAELGTSPYSPAMAKDSPASFVSNSSPAGPVGQSLYSELGELNDGDDDTANVDADNTPSRASLLSRATPRSGPNTVQKTPANWGSMPPRAEMRDAAIMTEPWEPVRPPREFPLVKPTVAARAPSASVATQSEPSPTPAFHPLTESMINSFHAAPLDISGTSRGPPLQISGIQSQQTQPVLEPSSMEAPPEPTRQPPPPPPLAFSPIRAQATEPLQPSPTTASPTVMSASTSSPGAFTPTDGSGTPDRVVDYPRRSLFGSVLNWRKPSGSAPLRPADDASPRETPEKAGVLVKERPAPLGDISHNVGDRGSENREPLSIVTGKSVSTPAKPIMEVADQGAQTMLSAEEIENLMRDKGKKAAVVAPLSPSRSLHGSPVLRSNRSQESVGGSVGRARTRLSEPGFSREELAALKTFKRPGSSGSVRSSTGAHPPLPPDHKQAIAAAAQRVSLDQTGLMGPPLVPASAYRANTSARRPHTPSSQFQQSPNTRGGTTPRARYSARSDVTSPVGTRRSSVSSFASELDERFNIRTDGLMTHSLDVPGTDPRMIQAITSTMIGEYLWKYTRKAGRSQTSDKRHRRFFWVHPYTRTLYWSETNPATAGRAEVKAKSVHIESVQVVTDDNPMPPGLHRKSIVVVTPGRSVKFTATTQRLHETWFNALSYLLVRNGTEGSSAPTYDPHEYYSSMTAEDVDEFNPSSVRRNHSRGAASLSSYNSRTTRHTSPGRDVASPSRSRLGPSGQPVVNSMASRTSQASGPPGSMARFSTMLRSGTAIRGSFSSRKSRNSARESIYNASEVHDSAEDLREAYARQEHDVDRLENVRACCDGELG